MAREIGSGRCVDWTLVGHKLTSFAHEQSHHASRRISS